MKVGKLPYKVKYTHYVKGGEQDMFAILINPKFRNDKWMHVHEYQHIKQWYAVTAISFILIGLFAYLFNPIFAWFCLISPFVHEFLYKQKFYRKWAEVQAFRAEIPYNETTSIMGLAYILANSYGLDITQDEAIKLLSRE